MEAFGVLKWSGNLFRSMLLFFIVEQEQGAGMVCSKGVVLVMDEVGLVGWIAVRPMGSL